ncbi:MAG: M12 family metallo-peptidase [Planctomycetota bacterium]|jgi:hypothetical protein
MKKYALLLAIPALAFVAINPDTSGPYTDSQGVSYDRLPTVADYPTVADFDAAMGHEVFTTRDGHQFQLDRKLTPSELAATLAAQAATRAMQPRGGSGSTIAAVVTTNHPIDEEFRNSYATLQDVKNKVISEVGVCDAALNSNWGIDFVPSSGQQWDSRDTADSGALLDEAFNEHGYNGKDMMIALSDDPGQGGVVGIAYIGLPRQLTFKYNNLEGEIMQHEAGHNYTLYHCGDSTCIMYAFLNGSNLGRFHNFFDGQSGQNHYTTMDNQRNRY